MKIELNINDKSTVKIDENGVIITSGTTVVYDSKLTEVHVKRFAKNIDNEINKFVDALKDLGKESK